MIVWGINALNHDASIAVVSNDQLMFWKRSSEYTNVPGDDKLNSAIIRDAIRSASDRGPDRIVWYERPWLKKTRQLYAGQYNWAFDMAELPSRYLDQFNIRYAKITYMPHHLSHAAGGFLTSGFDRAAVVVLDAMGEWESATVWLGEGTKLTKLWSRSYPTSLGLFYSAFTDLIGLTPVREEHRLQQLSSEGDALRYFDKVKSYWDDHCQLKKNLHKGVRDWPWAVREQDRADIAAAVQLVFEQQAEWVMQRARDLTGLDTLVYVGGCAMNGFYNQKMAANWRRIYVPKIPGDAGSSLGAALYYQQCRVKLEGRFVK